MKPLQILILRGPEAPRWQHALAARYTPSRMVFAIPADTPEPAGCDRSEASARPGRRLSLHRHDLLGAVHAP